MSNLEKRIRKRTGTIVLYDSDGDPHRVTVYTITGIFTPQGYKIPTKVYEINKEYQLRDGRFLHKISDTEFKIAGSPHRLFTQPPTKESEV